MKINNIKEIAKERCMLLVEDLDLGDVYKVYNTEQIKSYKKLYPKDNYIIIKNPTQEQKKILVDMLIKSGEGDITKSKLTQLELMTNIIPMITTLDFNPNRKTDIKKLKLLLSPDSRPQVMNELDKELGKILTSIINEWIEYAQTISELPEHQQEVLLNELQQMALKDRIEDEKMKLDEMKEVVENANI